MVNFRYTAKDTAGEAVTGVERADSEAALLQVLTERGLYPVHIGVADEAERKVQTGRKRIRLRQVGTMFRQMSDLLRSGVPMIRTLQTLEKTTPNEALRDVIRQLRSEVSQGRPFADAIGGAPDVFETLQEAVIRAGEEGGFLEDVLQDLGDYVERRNELRSRVMGMLLYPIVLTLFGGLIVVGILVFLVPMFKGYFANIELPLPTRAIFLVSELLTEHYVLLLAAVVLLGVGLRSLFRSEWGRLLGEKIRFGMPLVGNINRSVSTTRICRILGTMLGNGVPILKALTISRDAAGSLLLTEAMSSAIDSVRDGQPLAAPLRNSGQFDPEIVEMVAVAEESNRMPVVLTQIADTLERRTNSKIDHFVRLIEPVIIMMMGITIAFLALGLLYPVFLMSKALE